jgi:serine/threonine-protein kinase ULK/ATG1
MSPEILAKKEFSAKCDVWSLGMTFYEMLYGKTPWSAGNIPALLMNIKNQKL